MSTFCFKDFVYMVLSYLFLFLPQLNLINKIQDQHIGNITAHRIAGYSYLQIARQWPYFPLLAIFFSALSDIFGQKMRAYKWVHISVVSFIGPMLYIFMFILTGSHLSAFLSCVAYAFMYNLPVTLNYLVQPEQYELLFCLAGGSLSLLGLDIQIKWLLCFGFFLLGTTQLWKAPGLASISMLVYIFTMYFKSNDNFWFFAIFYILPVGIFLTTIIIFSGENIEQRHLSIVYYFKTLFVSLFKNLYVYYNDFIKSPLYSHLLELLPFIYLTSICYAFWSGDLTFFTNGFIITSFIFVMKFCFWYSYAVILFLSMTAGIGAEVLITLNLLPLYVFLCVTFIIVILRVSIYAPNHWVFTLNPPFHVNDSQIVSQYIIDNSDKNDGFLINIFGPYTYMHVLAQRVFSNKYPLLLWLFTEQIRHDLPGIISVLQFNPPSFMVVKIDEAVIFNIDKIESLSGHGYAPVLRCGSFLIYKLQLNEKQILYSSLDEVSDIFTSSTERIQRDFEQVESLS